MSSTAAKVGAVLIGVALVVLSILAPSVMVFSLVWLPGIAVLVWAVWILVLFRDIRYEHRALRIERRGDTSPETRW